MSQEQDSTIPPLTVFYSYAHEDEALRDRLEEHLSSLRKQGLISEWYDRQIVAGAEWAYAIDSHLQAASIILLLISPAFMASDYCVSIEMQQAMERHRLGDARVIPIILKPTEWHDAPFAILQCLPHDARPVATWDNLEDAFEDIAQGLRHAVEEMNLLFYGRGSRSRSEPMILAPSDDQQRKVSNHLPSLIDSQNRQRMLERVRALWITGLLKDSLNEAALITLGLREQPDAVANPWSFSLQEMKQPARPLRLGTRIIQAYDYAQGELLILGEPGSGKTTLLLELTRDLIERTKRDEAHPIPVVFNLSSWSLKQQPIADWLVEELVFKYQVPRKLARHWVETEQILPLLDGLDEVAPNHRAACIETLNMYKQDHGLLPMVICSRSADYLAQQSRVLLRTAIVIQPLTQGQIELYLASAKKQLAPVREALQADTALQELASTPLMLSILTLAYHGSSMNDLLETSSPLARRQQIFATYIQRMFQRRGVKAPYTPQQTIQWLAWLARQMTGHSQTEFYIERMQPSWLLDESWHRLYHAILTGITIGPAYGLVVFIGEVVAFLYFWLHGSIHSWMVGWLVLIGIAVPLIGGLFFGLIGGIDSRMLNHRRASGLIFGLVSALLAGVGIDVFLSLLGMQTSSVSLRLFIDVSCGLLLGVNSRVNLVRFAGRHTPIELTEDIGWSWSNMRQGLVTYQRLGCVVGLRFGCLVGFLAGVGIVLVQSSIWGLTASGLGLGLVFPLLGGAGVGLIMAILLGLIGGFKLGLVSKTLPEEEHIKPNQGIWRSMRHGIFLGLGAGLSIGSIFGFVGSLIFGPVGGVSIGFICMLIVGPISWASGGGRAFIKHIILRFLLWSAGSVPWNYVHFLDYAAERILLRKVGGGYIFIHRLLLKYFVEAEDIRS